MLGNIIVYMVAVHIWDRNPQIKIWVLAESGSESEQCYFRYQ